MVGDHDLAEEGVVRRRVATAAPHAAIRSRTRRERAPAHEAVDHRGCGRSLTVAGDAVENDHSARHAVGPWERIWPRGSRGHFFTGEPSMTLSPPCGRRCAAWPLPR